MTDTPKVDATRLKDDLKALGKSGAIKALRNVFRKYAKQIRAKAIAGAPERTGLLKSTIRIRFKERRQGGVRALITVGSKVFDKKEQRKLGHKGAFYAGMQEYGFTDRGGKEHEGKYFMADALEGVEDAIMDNIVAELDAAIKKGKAGA